MTEQEIDKIRTLYGKLLCSGDYISPAANAVISYVPALLDAIPYLKSKVLLATQFLDCLPLAQLAIIFPTPFASMKNWGMLIRAAGKQNFLKIRSKKEKAATQGALRGYRRIA